MDFRFKAAMAILAVLGVMFFYRMSHPATVFAADGTDPDWDAAVQRSRAAGMPTVLLFTAGWCPACRALHEGVLSRGDVQEELDRHYSFFTVDLTNPSPQMRMRSQKFGVRYIPQLIRYDADGKETGRTNYLPAEQLIAWLKAGE